MLRTSTSITHTINVVEQIGRSYWGPSERCVTKYVIHVHLADGLEWQVARRYSHFRSNHAALSSMFSQIRLPKLPPKTLSMEQLSGSSTAAVPDPEVVASRLVLLDAYLKALLANPAVAGCTSANHVGRMPWYAARNVRICVQPATAGCASICLRYASSSTMRDATVSGSGGANEVLPMLSTLGGSFGSRSCENIELSAE